jgi:hypothetical protein
MNANLKSYLDKSKEVKNSFWSIHYPKMNKDEQLYSMEGQIAQLKRQIDKTQSLLKWALIVSALALVYLTYGKLFENYDFEGIYLIIYFVLVFCPLFAAWKTCDEFGDGWDEPFSDRKENPEAWSKYFRTKNK